MDFFKLRIWIYKLKQKFKSILFPVDPNTDYSYFEAIEFIKRKPFVTYNQLQKGLNIGYARVVDIMKLLEKNHKIGPKENDKEKRKVITENWFIYLVGLPQKHSSLFW